MMQINDGNGALPAIYIDAGIHAREWIAQSSLLYIIDKVWTSSKFTNNEIIPLRIAVGK